MAGFQYEETMAISVLGQDFVFCRNADMMSVSVKREDGCLCSGTRSRLLQKSRHSTEDPKMPLDDALPPGRHPKAPRRSCALSLVECDRSEAGVGIF